MPVDLSMPLPRARDAWVRALERRYVEHLLRESGGNVTQAARRAGVSRAYLYRLLKRYKLD